MRWSARATQWRMSNDAGLREVWEEGRAFVDLAVRQSAVAEARAAIETARKAMRKKLPPPENTLSQPGPSQHSGQDFLSPEDYVEQDEIFKVRHMQYMFCSILHKLAGRWAQERNAVAPKPRINPVAA